MGFVLARAAKYPAIKPGADASVTHDTTDPVDASVPGGPIDFGGVLSADIQLVWKNIVGTGGYILVNTSPDGINWTPKTEASVTIVDSDGNDTVALEMRASGEYYQVLYFPAAITGGTISCLIFGK